MTKKTKIILGVVLAFAILLGIGYAAITANELSIEGTANADGKDTAFVVKFAGAPTSTKPDGVTVTSIKAENLEAEFDVSGLTTKGQTVTVTYAVENASSDNLDAILTQKSLTNSNEDYFTVTSNLTTNTGVAINNGDSTNVTITITLRKTPVNSVTTTIALGLEAKPVEETL